MTAGGSGDTSNDEDTTKSIYVQSELNQVLEITPTVAKVERLRALLRDSQYDERIEDEDSDKDEGMEVEGQPQRKVRPPAHPNTSALIRHNKRNATLWRRFGH